MKPLGDGLWNICSTVGSWKCQSTNNTWTHILHTHDSVWTNMTDSFYSREIHLAHWCEIIALSCYLLNFNMRFDGLPKRYTDWSPVRGDAVKYGCRLWQPSRPPSGFTAAECSWPTFKTRLAAVVIPTRSFTRSVTIVVCIEYKR